MKGRLIGLVCAGAFCFGQVSAQELPPEITLMVEEVLGEQSSEELSIALEELARKKPNINNLGREELESTHLLSIFQIESILDHRLHFGDILSKGELAVIDGFNRRKADLCSYFFSFSSSAPPADTTIHTGRQSALAKVKKAFGSEGVSLTGKYQGEHLPGKENSISWGITADSDAGEKLSDVCHPDFTSAYIQFKKKGFQVIAGDYSVRFGQGLVVWKAFSIASPSSPSGMIKKGNAILPYRSTDESNFFRGAAASFKAGKTDITAFISYNALDARIVDGKYTSIVTGGYHRSEAELAKRRTMHEFVAGGGASREVGRWRIGVSAITYFYDKRNGRTVKEYNKYQIYDGLWGNVGVNCFAHWHNWRIAGEAAIDFGGGGAAILTAAWSPFWELETSLTGRYYSKRYIATHAGAYSTLSDCANQTGITLSSKWLPSDHWEMNLFAEYSYYGWARYNIPDASDAFKFKLRAIRKFGEFSSADAELRWSGGILSGRINGSLSLSDNVSLEGRVAANTGGFGAFAGGKLTLLKGQMSLSVRGTIYNTEDYDHRIYFYEGDVPQSFSVKSYYGKGWGAYALVKYTPRLKNKRMKPELWFKVSQEASSLFLRFSME